MTPLSPQDWASEAACRNLGDRDYLFVQGAAQREARQMCFTCPVRRECLVDALDSRTEYGIWGGLTERERRALHKRYPHVTDWDEWLDRDDNPVAAMLRTQRPPVGMAGLLRTA